MTYYTNFFGIDIGKFNFVISINTTKTKEYENSSTGISQFIKDFKDDLVNALCVLETTGGYELEILYTLINHGYNVHRADTRKVKNFIRSLGTSAKTDALDAKALSIYASERKDKLELFKLQSQEHIILFQLIQRRHDLNQMLVTEKNRSQHKNISTVRDSVDKIIKLLKQELNKLTEKIKELINSNEELKAKHEILKSVPGIGDIVAFELLVLLPELGKLDRRKIASLAGVAPRANESGRYIGYRSTGYGRQDVKKILFMAAMAARKSHSSLGAFYEKLIARGKKKMVALTALMRKILVIANAKLKNLQIASQHS